MADPALAHPAAAHPELADPAARLRLRRRRPGRLYARHRCRRHHHPLCRSRRRTGAYRHDRAHRTRGTGRLRDPGQRRRPPRPCRGAGHRGVQPSGDPGRRRRRPVVHHDAHPAHLPRSRPAPRRRGPRRRRVSHRRPARQRDPPVGAPGNPGRRRTRPAAPHLPRPRHLLVARGHGPASRTLRPDRRPHPRPPPPLAAAHRYSPGRYDRPQHAYGARNPHRRAPRPYHRWRGPVLRGTRQHLRARRPEDEPVPEPGRPVGHGLGPRRRPSATAPVRTHPRRPPHPLGTGPHERGGHHRAVGDRLPARPLLARHPRA